MKVVALAALLIACGGSSKPRPTAAIEIGETWTGASAAEVEARVVTPIERALASVHGVASITSRADAQTATITLEVVPGRDPDRVLSDARQALEATLRELPPAADPPEIRKVRVDDRPVLAFALRGDQPAEAMAQIAEHVVVRELERLPGVGRVEARGFTRAAVIVRPELDRLAMYGVTPGELVAAIAAGSVTVRGVVVDGGGQLRAIGPLSDVAALGELVVRSPNGASVKVRDVATVERGVVRAAHPGPARVAVYAQLGVTRREVREALRAKVRTLALPAGVRLEELPAPVEPKLAPRAASIVGPDHGVLGQLALAVVRELGPATEVVLDPGVGEPSFEVTIDRDRAALLGVSIVEVSAAAQLALGEQRAGEVTLDGLALPILVRPPDEPVTDRVPRLHVRAAGGASVPLSDLVAVVQTDARPLLHRDLVRAIDLRASGEAAAKVRAVLVQHAAKWPTGYRVVRPR